MEEKNSVHAMVNSDFEIIHSTPEFSDILGFTTDEIVGRRVLVDEEVMEKIRKKGHYSGYAVFLNSSAMSVYADCEVSRDGEGYRIFIKEHRTVDYKMLHQVFRKSPAPIMILSENHTILDANDAMVNLTSMSREEMIGKKCYTIMHRTTYPEAGCPLVDALVNGKENGMNVMPTVYGNLFINVKKIDERIFVHFAEKEAALLLEAQNRMMSLLERYSRVLYTTTLISEIMISERDKRIAFSKMAEKLAKVDEFEGVAFFLKENDVLIRFATYGTIPVTEDFIRDNAECLQGDVRKKKIDGKNHVFFPITYKEFFGIMAINVGEVKLSEDELSVLKELGSRMGMYLSYIEFEAHRRSVEKFLLDAMENFGILVDRIRNPLYVIMATAEVEVEDEEIRKKIIDNVSRIKEITGKIDELWNESERLMRELKRT